MDLVPIIEQLAPGARLQHTVALTGGVSAEVWDVGLAYANGDVDRVVVRRHRDFVGKPDRLERAAREHALLAALHGRGLPVPRSRLFVPPDTLVLDHIDGSTALPDDPVEALGATLAGIHAIEANPALPALPLLDDPLPALVTWLPALLAADPSAGLLVPHAHLRAACSPYSGTPRLLHGDYWPGNVLWRDGRLVAVIDWEDAALGDPLSDVACARVELHFARGEVTAERFTASYARSAAIDADRLAWWDLFVSTAACQSMDDWGLAPDVLAVRKAATTAFQASALARLGIA